jgi:hypothetical protein
MSQVRVSGNASGTGILTVTSPNTNSNYTLTLPAATGTVLTNNTLPAGTVLQVVQGSSSTGVINNTGTYADTGLTATITPASSANKILINASVPFQLGTNGGSGQLQFNIVRNSTELVSNLSVNNVSAIVQLGLCQMMLWLDSPSTTSATTYKIQFRELAMSGRYGNSAVIPTWNAAQTGVIQVMEIAG